MGVIQLSDELNSVIERHVAEGKAASPTAFLEEAVRRLVDDTRSEDHELLLVAEAGSLDIELGRYTTIATREDEEHLLERMMARLSGPPATR